VLGWPDGGDRPVRFVREVAADLMRASPALISDDRRATRARVLIYWMPATPAVCVISSL
jgi:hypothetical protein